MKTLKLGDSGKEVTELQLLLISHQFTLSADGQFGPATKKAVKEFQLSRNLQDDGIVGELTWAALEKSHNVEVVHDPITKIEDLDDRTLKYFNTLDEKAKSIFLPFIIEAKKLVKELGYDYFAISGTRGEKEQNDLYAQGRTKPGRIVTNARFGQSNHNAKIALDFAVFKDGKYLDDSEPATAEKIHTLVGQIAPKYGLDWGGLWKFKDTPHFEVKTGLTMAQKMKLIKEKGSVL